MIPRHHPGDEILQAHAGGHLAEGFALAVALHLAVCPRCRRLTEGLETAGGALLEALPPTPLAAGALAATLARIRGRGPEAPPPAPLPFDPRAWWRWPPLDHYLHGRTPRWWRPLGGGIGYHPIRRRGRSGASAILLRLAPGRALPRHDHAGPEMSIVLRGGYSDAFGRFDPGDFASADAGLRHKPVADPDGECIALVALAGPLQFGGKRARWLQALAGI
jgi:putative transcriptional regulator